MVLQQRANVTLRYISTQNKCVKVTVDWNAKKYAVVANASGYFEIGVQTSESVAKSYEISFNDGKELLLKNPLPVCNDQECYITQMDDCLKNRIDYDYDINEYYL